MGNSCMKFMRSLLFPILLVTLFLAAGCAEDTSYERINDNIGIENPPGNNPTITPDNENTPAPLNANIQIDHAPDDLIIGFEASRANVGGVEISFIYEKISGSASNQFAIWIEDMGGNHIRTLYATKWTARGGYKSRPDSIPIWVPENSMIGPVMVRLLPAER